MSWRQMSKYHMQHTESGATISRANVGGERWRYTLWPSAERTAPFDSVHDTADAARARHAELLEAAK